MSNPSSHPNLHDNSNGHERTVQGDNHPGKAKEFIPEEGIHIQGLEKWTDKQQELDKKQQELDKKHQEFDKKLQELDKKHQELDKKHQELDKKLQEVSEKINPFSTGEKKSSELQSTDWKPSHLEKPKALLIVDPGVEFCVDIFSNVLNQGFMLKTLTAKIFSPELKLEEEEKDGEEKRNNVYERIFLVADQDGRYVQGYINKIEELKQVFGERLLIFNFRRAGIQIQKDYSNSKFTFGYEVNSEDRNYSKSMGTTDKFRLQQILENLLPR